MFFSVSSRVNMSDLENLPAGIHASRRHLMKMGAIAAPAMLAVAMKTTRANAIPCATAVGCHCFLKGTTIRTADGDRKVEDLAVGDLLPTVFGGIRPIQWIGRYSFKKSNPAKAWVRDILPVRVARSALGPDVPHADLYVTQAHALLIDGLLVPARLLINDTSITLYDSGELEALEFFHIKLELHNVIYAEGAPCETLVSVDENAANFAEYLRQYGPPMIEDARCAPLVGFGRRIEIKSRFRSAISPWIDRRQKFDVIRDKLEERGIALLKEPELVS
jgi:Hint domain